MPCLLLNQISFRFPLSRLAGHLASEADLVGGSKIRAKDEPASYESGSLLAGEWFTSIESLEEMALAQPGMSMGNAPLDPLGNSVLQSRKDAEGRHDLMA
jgi:hypothetical protein